MDLFVDIFHNNNQTFRGDSLRGSYKSDHNQRAPTYHIQHNNTFL